MPKRSHPQGSDMPKGPNMIPLTAQIQEARRFICYHSQHTCTYTKSFYTGQTSTCTQRQTARQAVRFTDKKEDNLHFSKHITHLFILVTSVHAVLSTQIHSISTLQDHIQRSLLISPRSYYTVTVNCVLTCVTSVEFSSR